MYAQLVMLTLGPGTRSAAEKLADQFAPILKTLKGFKRITFFGDETVGVYGSFSLWESKEDAEATAAVTGPKIEQAVGGIAKSPPVRQYFEVYEPKV